MSSNKHFNRTYELSIKGEGINISVNNLDLRFDVNFFVGPRTGKADITVIGLNEENISKLEPYSVVPPGILMSRSPIDVELKAGYEGNNQLIFKGVIFSVSLSAPPELAITINARAMRTQTDMKQIGFSVERGLTLESIASSAISMFGKNFINESHVNAGRTLPAKSFSGDLFSVMLQIQNMANWYLTYDSIDNVVYANDDYPQSAIDIIDKHSGLLGVPSINSYSATICTWLEKRRTFSIGKYIKLDSELHPSGNGDYWINSIKYKGEYRGKSWYSLYNGIKRIK